MENYRILERKGVFTVQKSKPITNYEWGKGKLIWEDLIVVGSIDEGKDYLAKLKKELEDQYTKIVYTTQF